MVMGNTSSGTYTYVKLYLIRTGYDVNYVNATLLHEVGSSGNYTYNFDVNEEGYITFTPTIGCRLCIL